MVDDIVIPEKKLRFIQSQFIILAKLLLAELGCPQILGQLPQLILVLFPEQGRGNGTAKSLKAVSGIRNHGRRRIVQADKPDKAAVKIKGSLGIAMDLLLNHDAVFQRIGFFDFFDVTHGQAGLLVESLNPAVDKGEFYLLESLLLRGYPFLAPFHGIADALAIVIQEEKVRTVSSEVFAQFLADVLQMGGIAMRFIQLLSQTDQQTLIVGNRLQFTHLGFQGVDVGESDKEAFHPFLIRIMITEDGNPSCRFRLPSADESGNLGECSVRWPERSPLKGRADRQDRLLGWSSPRNI
jgi:hypothetical protein